MRARLAIVAIVAAARAPSRFPQITSPARARCEGPRRRFRTSCDGRPTERIDMKTLLTAYRRRLDRHGQQGGVGWVVLWLLGVPIPVLIVLFLLRGCT